MPKFTDIEYAVDTGGGLVAMETNSVSDVMQGVDIRRGIPITFTRRVADTGTCNMYLKNSGNKYSPDHGSALAGFQVGADARLRVEYDSTWYTIFRGIIDGIYPDANSKGQRRTYVTHVDHMDELRRQDIGAETLRTSKRADQEIDTLVNNVITPVGESYATAQSTFDYVGYRHGQSVAGAIADLVDSEGYPAAFYIQDDGTVTFEDRHARRIDTTSDWTLSNSMSGLTIARRRADVWSEIGVTIHPADVATANEVLGSVSATITVQPGETRTIRVPYRDPDNENVKHILGHTVVTVSVGTDIEIEDAATGGSDISGDFTITHTKGANASDIELTNNGEITGFVVTLQVRGLGVRFYEDIDFATSTGAGTKNKLILDHRFNDDEEFARNQADWLAAWLDDERAVVTDLYVRPSNDTLMTMILSAEVTDVVLLTETQTGLSSDRYFINGIEIGIRGNGYIEAHYTLENADPSLGWVLGTAGRGELNEKTYLG